MRPAPSGEVINEESFVPTTDGGEYESTPSKRTDVIRESDVYEANDLPEEGLTSRQRQLYRRISENQLPAYTPSGVSKKVSAVISWLCLLTNSIELRL